MHIESTCFQLLVRFFQSEIGLQSRYLSSRTHIGARLVCVTDDDVFSVSE